MNTIKLINSFMIINIEHSSKTKIYLNKTKERHIYGLMIIQNILKIIIIKLKKNIVSSCQMFSACNQ